MTDLLTMTTALTLPRVNLLPPEIGEARRLRRVQMGLGLGVLAVVTVIGLGYVMVGHDVDSAQTGLDGSRASATQVQTRIAALSDVPKTYAQVAGAQGQLSTAMADEVRWSFRLNELSLTIPPRVWLTSMGVTKSVAAASSTATPATAGESIAVVSFEGSAYSYNDVATWLVKVSDLRDAQGKAVYRNVYLGKVATAPVGDQAAVSFTSSAELSKDALSGRYTDKAGS